MPWRCATSCATAPRLRRTPRSDSAILTAAPYRRRTGAPRVTGRSARASAADRRRQLDRGAVAPGPLEGVEGPLLLVLDVDDDLGVVDEHPAAVTLALA